MPKTRVKRATPPFPWPICRRTSNAYPLLSQRNFNGGSGNSFVLRGKKTFILLLIALFEGFKPRRSKDSLAFTYPSPRVARGKLTTSDDDAHIVLELIRQTSTFIEGTSDSQSSPLR
jgi:hypothetical protein